MINHENKKDNVVFIHANGFPPASYDSILENLKNNYKVDNFLLRPLWAKTTNYNNLKSWELFYKDFEDFLDNSKIEKCIGLGHSIGGNIVLHTAIKKQNLFSKIILLDPTLYPPRMIFIWKIINFFKLQHYFLDLSRNTEKKTMKYNTKNEMFQKYRSKKIFQNIDDDILMNYINSITHTKKYVMRSMGRYRNRTQVYNKVEITYCNKWEKQIYNKGLLKDNYIWKNIHKLKIPCLIIRAHKSTALPLSSIKKIKKKNKLIKVETLRDVTHLFPFEQPKIAIKKINNFI